MSIKRSSEKIRSRDVRNLAVAQWLRSMPDEGGSDLLTNRVNTTTSGDTETENVIINVEQASDIDKTHSVDNICNESSVNACSTKPLRLHGNKCLINDPGEKSRAVHSAKSLKRVQFNINANYDETDDKADDATQRVKYDVIIRTAEDDNAELKRSMSKYLVESAVRKELKNQNTHNKHIRSSKYVVNTEDTECHADTECNKRVTPVDETSTRSRKSSRSTREFDDVIFDKRTLRTATPGQSSQRNQYNQSSISTKSPGGKRLTRQRPKIVYLKHSTGTEEIQAPVIKGLVVDVVENQKPSVVRASKNANIREEFALRQKVEGYRTSCSQNINNINFAQRKLSTNLINLRNRMAQRALAINTFEDDHLCLKTLSEKLFMQSKGYFPEMRSGSRAYNFPPLTYPKRRVLTIS